MDVTSALLDILVVLLAAKAASELAERLSLPSVVGEIVAGVLIGPSVLGLVKGGQVLAVLGELGVILLLLEVGLQMDLGELGAVGKAAMSVAVVGVVVPFATGTGVGLLTGMDGTEALFVGAALTATSVGITARVFGDLRALAMVEARTVLGAAVADDVLGLVILTVVVRLVSAGSVSLLDLGVVVLVAVGFLVVSLAVGVKLVPPLFALLARHSRSAGTLVALALAFTLGVAELANAAKLAPIVGAFVAGVVLARSAPADRIRRELTPVGHLFIPVFFLQIGIDADIGDFAKPAVLGVAGALLVVAVLGKVVSIAGLGRSPGDRLLIGLGMIPRGEVGLIFATLGLQQHVFGHDIYAALLLVVLVTTLLTPPALRWRLVRLRAAAGTAAEPPATEPPPGGWLSVAEETTTVDLAAIPPPERAILVAFDAVPLLEHNQPGPRLLEWLGSLPDRPLAWDDAARAALVRLLETAGPRGWRFLQVSGMLGRAVPELDAAIARRASDPFDLDPGGALRWRRVIEVRRLLPRHPVRYPERVLIAALLLDATDGEPTAAAELGRGLAERIGLDDETADAMAALAADAALLPAAAGRPSGMEEEAVLQLATHLSSVEQVRALHLLACAGGLEPLSAQAVQALIDLIEASLEHPDLVGRGAGDSVTTRRAEAVALVEDSQVKARIDAAPRAYVLSQGVVDLARHAQLCEPRPEPDEPRVSLAPLVTDRLWRVEIVALDRVGLLAHETGVLAGMGLDLVDAVVATWPDGAALLSCAVRSFERPTAKALTAALGDGLRTPLSTPPLPGVTLNFDDFASPWHTLCRVEVENRFGLVHALTAAFTAAGASVHAARLDTSDDKAIDFFELTGPSGRKVDEATKRAIRDALGRGVATRRRLLHRTGRLVTADPI